MGQHYALGIAGGARGVDDGRKVDVDVPSRGCAACVTTRERVVPAQQAGYAPCAVVVQLSRYDHAPEVARPGRSGPHVVELRLGDQRRRPAVLDQVTELVGFGE